MDKEDISPNKNQSNKNQSKLKLNLHSFESENNGS